MEYKPAPFDASRITLNREITELDELLARNAHDNWARLRIMEGWRYGPERNDTRKEHPNLVPFDQLPESEKEYDRQTALETIRILLAMGYTIQPPMEKLVSSGVSSVAIEDELKNALQLLENPEQDLTSLQRLWRAHDPKHWSSNPEIYRLLAERILRMGEPLLAYDIVAEGVKYSPKSLPLRRLLGLALARSGAAGSANAVLLGLYEEGHRDEETLGLLARTHKDLAGEAASVSEATQHLRQAYEFYSQAYQATGGYWSGINAATLALMIGDRERSIGVAREVSQRCHKKLDEGPGAKADRYWVLSTLGEAALLLENWPEAEHWYRQAIEEGRDNWGSLQSTRHNALLLVERLGGDTKPIQRLFRFPTVVVFAGHMIDQPNREITRFPPQLEHAVTNAIRKRLKKFNAGIGYASTACGSDIIFHEVIQEMKGESHVVLPYEKDVFIRDCADIVGGGDWARRCERVIAEAAEVQEAVTHGQMRTSVSYEFSSLILHGLASMRAEQLQTKLVPMAVWDGNPGDGPGGTAETVKRWRKNGLSVEIIDLGEILRGELPDSAMQETASVRTVSSHATEPVPQFDSEIRALLFADAEGFSRLTEEEAPRFVQDFLGLVARLGAESVHKPLMRNTWGDGLYLVFSNVRDAGQFALELRDCVRNTDWAGKGLPPLNLRIGLHAGPVYSCTDPVTQRTNYIGTHVTRAARIEPVTPSGQIYASQTFAALAAAEGVKEFRCDYVGQISMAKKYGTFPTYVVLRRSLA